MTFNVCLLPGPHRASQKTRRTFNPSRVYYRVSQVSDPFYGDTPRISLSPAIGPDEGTADSFLLLETSSKFLLLRPLLSATGILRTCHRHRVPGTTEPAGTSPTSPRGSPSSPPKSQSWMIQPSAARPCVPPPHG